MAALEVPSLAEIEALLRRVVREELAASRPDMLTTDQAAAIAGVQPKTIRGWVLSGRLEADRRGRTLRISRAALDACLAGEDPEKAELLRTLPSGR